MFKLEAGKKYTQAQIAEWMGVTASHFSRTKDSKNEELGFFCNFYIEGTKYFIQEVFEDTYVKRAKRNFDLVKRVFPEEWKEEGDINQCSNVTVKIQDKYSKNLTSSYETAYKYTLRSKKEYIEEGVLKQEPVFVIKKGINGNAHFRELDAGEWEIVRNLIRTFFGDHEAEELLILKMNEEGEITGEECIQKIRALKRLTNAHWLDFLKAAKRELDLDNDESLSRATRLTESAF